MSVKVWLKFPVSECMPVAKASSRARAGPVAARAIGPSVRVNAKADRTSMKRFIGFPEDGDGSIVDSPGLTEP
jgi:hypothetical protein